MAAAGIELEMQSLLQLRPDLQEPKKKHLPSAQSTGAITGKKRGAGVDLHELRAYQQGDDIRHIDINASARTGRTHIKTYLEERDHAAVILVDFRQSMFWGTKGALRSYTAAHVAVREAWEIVELGGRVALVIVMDEDLHHVPAQDGLSGMMRICEELCHFHNLNLHQTGKSEHVNSLQTALEFVRQMSERNAAIRVVTGLDHLGAEYKNAVLALRRRKLSLSIIRDPFESAERAGALPVLNADGEIEWVTHSKEKSDDAIVMLRQSGTPFRIVESGVNA